MISTFRHRRPLSSGDTRAIRLFTRVSTQSLFLLLPICLYVSKQQIIARWLAKWKLERETNIEMREREKKERITSSTKADWATFRVSHTKTAQKFSAQFSSEISFNRTRYFHMGGGGGIFGRILEKSIGWCLKKCVAKFDRERGFLDIVSWMTASWALSWISVLSRSL